MNIGHIQGGTNAGWRKVIDPGVQWECVKCGVVNARYWTTCSQCNSRKDSEESHDQDPDEG